MPKDVYVIKSEKIEDWYNKTEEIEANISLILLFCREYSDVDDLYKLMPILKNTYKTADKLYADLIETKYNS